VLWRMAIILKVNKVNLFVYSVLFAFWYHSSNFLGTPRMFKRNIEARSHNHCCSGKTIIIHVLSVCLQPSLFGMQSALYFHLWPLRIKSIFPRYLIKGTFFEKKCYSTWILSYDSPYKFGVKRFSF
jgi:hypothetical protein